MNLVELYQETGDFQEVVKKSGLPPYIVHIHLAKAGILKIKDKIQFGTKGAKLGGEAEELFQKLVPEAADANSYWRRNNPSFDFMYKGITIDVKYSSYHEKTRKDGVNRGAHWKIRTAGERDLIVAFLEREAGQELENPIILLLPTMFIDVKNGLAISKASKWLTNFQIEADKLTEVLDGYAEILDGEQA